MPRKVRELIRGLHNAGFIEVKGGKGSHRKFVHSKHSGAVTVSGQLGDDVKHYQEKQVN
jgi:predicted RNA binding protein YcfA (HicA-like mRNA interferase family)